jgi:phosphoribosylanthranilate isomerase
LTSVSIGKRGEKRISPSPGISFLAIISGEAVMIVQIYTMQTPEEAREAARLGVDHLGVTPGEHGLPGEVSFDKAREIFEALGERAVKVALTVDSDPAIIEAMVQAVRPDVLHICGRPIEAVPPEAVEMLKKRLPWIKVMIAIPVNGPGAVDTALGYAAAADFLILDTDVSHINGIGASGETHDWRISRRIVEAVDVPVILAGGLSPENVRDAIEAVGPYGVDSLTHTNLPLGGGRFRKDMDKIRRFVENARA